MLVGLALVSCFAEFGGEHGGDADDDGGTYNSEGIRPADNGGGNEAGGRGDDEPWPGREKEARGESESHGGGGAEGCGAAAVEG